MSRLLITGGTPLHGTVRIQGSKNSVLPILAATLLVHGTVRLRFCPHLLDVDTSIRILHALGCRAEREGDFLIVDASSVQECTIPDALMREMRSSVIFSGAILARCGSVSCGLPGGCELGPRPIDLHLSGFRAMGAEIEECGGQFVCRAEKLRGCEILLATPSVGATENLMLAACGAEGTTVISNAAREPEIVDLQTFLNSCGARVHGAGSGVVTVTGRLPLHGCTYPVSPDRIVTATYLCTAAAAGGDIYLRGAREEHLRAVTDRLRESGCNILSDRGGIICHAPARLKAVSPVQTAPYPGFPTDAQAVLMAALTRADGCTVFEENMFSSRYRHVDELRRMGADIRVSGRTAVVRGVPNLYGADVSCTDLRGGACLCVAAAGASGETRVDCLRHIDRGYENMERDLQALGVNIRRETDKCPETD